MSIGNEPGSPGREGLQFDQAEFEQAPTSVVSCAVCHRAIEDQYFEIDGTIVCEPCKSVIDERLRGGSGLVRFLRAVAFGTAAGALGTIAYAASIHFTHFNLSLISIFVGYLVGRAVRAGSQNRGGWIYQLTAVLLTYLAIGATYTSLGFLEINPGANPKAQPDLLIQVVYFCILTIIIPIANARESVISLAIIGFALWQAWKMNVKLKLVVTGPYLLGEGGPEGSIEGTTAHA